MANGQRTVLKKNLIKFQLLLEKMKKAKLEMETLGKILLLSAFLIIVLLMFVSCRQRFTDVGKVTAQEYFCFLTNTIEHYTPYFPTSCRTIVMEDEVNVSHLSNLIRKTWWMYGKGKYDLGPQDWKSGIFVKSPTFGVYAFKAGEDIQLGNLKKYMLEHDRGLKTKDARLSDWSFVEKGSEAKTVCMKEAIEKGKTYYITFYDSRTMIGEGLVDKIFIKKDQKPSVAKDCVSGNEELYQLCQVTTVAPEYQAGMEPGVYYCSFAGCVKEDEPVMPRYMNLQTCLSECKKKGSCNEAPQMAGIVYGA